MANRIINDILDDYLEERRKKENIPNLFRNKKKLKLEIFSIKKPSREDEEHLMISDESKTIIIEKTPWYNRIIEMFKINKNQNIKEDSEKEEESELEDLEKEFEKELETLEAEEEQIQEKRKTIMEHFMHKLNILLGIGKSKVTGDIDEKEFMHENLSEVDDVPKEIKNGKYVKLKLYRPQINSDIKKVLQITDNLLAKLPKEEKIRFMQTPEFDLYKSVFKKYRIKEPDDKVVSEEKKD